MRRRQPKRRAARSPRPIWGPIASTHREIPDTCSWGLKTVTSTGRCAFPNGAGARRNVQLRRPGKSGGLPDPQRRVNPNRRSADVPASPRRAHGARHDLRRSPDPHSRAPAGRAAAPRDCHPRQKRYGCSRLPSARQQKSDPSGSPCAKIPTSLRRHYPSGSRGRRHGTVRRSRPLSQVQPSSPTGHFRTRAPMLSIPSIP